MSDKYGPRPYKLPGAISLDPSVYTQGINMLVRDRRANRRETISDIVLFRMVESGTSKEFLSGRIKDISSGGVLCDTETTLNEGDLIDIFFKRQTAHADTCARAAIVRVNNLGARFEVGAKFV